MYVINVFLATYSVILAVFGTIGNLLTSYICTRKCLKGIPTYVFIGFMSLMDIPCLFFWNLNDFYLLVIGVTIGDVSDAACKITTFLHYFSTQSSVYILVSQFILF